jgi:hypothetical protein
MAINAVMALPDARVAQRGATSAEGSISSARHSVCGLLAASRVFA